jgi:hypothetical protein
MFAHMTPESEIAGHLIEVPANRSFPSVQINSDVFVDPFLKPFVKLRKAPCASNQKLLP